MLAAFAAAEITSGIASGRSISFRQRDRMVGSTRAGALLIKRNSDCCGGSSSTFNNALAALEFSSSTGSTMQIRQPSTAAGGTEKEKGSRGSSPGKTGGSTAPSLG